MATEVAKVGVFREMANIRKEKYVNYTGCYGRSEVRKKSKGFLKNWKIRFILYKAYINLRRLLYKEHITGYFMNKIERKKRGRL